MSISCGTRNTFLKITFCSLCESVTEPLSCWCCVVQVWRGDKIQEILFHSFGTDHLPSVQGTERGQEGIQKMCFFLPQQIWKNPSGSNRSDPQGPPSMPFIESGPASFILESGPASLQVSQPKKRSRGDKTETVSVLGQRCSIPWQPAWNEVCIFCVRRSLAGHC